MTLTAYPTYFHIKSLEFDHVVVDRWVSEIVLNPSAEDEKAATEKKVSKQVARQRKKADKHNAEMLQIGLQLYGGWDKDFKSNKNLRISLDKMRVMGLFTESDKRALRWAKRMQKTNQWSKVAESYRNQATSKPVQSVSELAYVLLSERLSYLINSNRSVIALGEMVPAT